MSYQDLQSPLDEVVLWGMEETPALTFSYKPASIIFQDTQAYQTRLTNRHCIENTLGVFKLQNRHLDYVVSDIIEGRRPDKVPEPNFIFFDHIEENLWYCPPEESHLVALHINTLKKDVVHVCSIGHTISVDKSRLRQGLYLLIGPRSSAGKNPI